MKLSKEARVGLLAVVTLTIFYLGFNYLKGLDLFSHNKEYYTYYGDVQGLQTSNPVTYNGVTVGRIMDIEPDQAANRVKVSFAIDSDIELTDNTVAFLADADLLGSKVVKILIGKGNPAPKNGEIKGEVQGGMMASAMQQITPTLAKADSLLLTLNKTIKQYDNTGTAMNTLLASATQATNNANATILQNNRQLAEITTNAARLTANLNALTTNLDAQIKPILAKTNTFADSLNAVEFGRTVNNLNASVANLESILNEINKGKGTVGKLTQDEALYDNLNATAASLDALLSDLKNNPKRYVHFSLFGGKNKEEKKPENTEALPQN